MFTGIIQGLGQLQVRSSHRLEVEIPPPLRDRLTAGASIAVNGVCLTVCRLTEKTFVADLTTETSSRTTLGALRPRTRVNLELPMTAERAFDGHWVLGHIDATGRIKAIERMKEGWEFVFSYPAGHRKYVAEKGCIAIDGISLTPYGATAETFRCAVIKETFQRTNFQDRIAGDPVNLEFDILAKYIERLMSHVH
jgi:riboflavin synthase